MSAFLLVGLTVAYHTKVCYEGLPAIWDLEGGNGPAPVVQAKG